MIGRRAVLALASAALLAACDSLPMPGMGGPPPPPDANFTLDGDGLLTNGNTNLIPWGTDEPNLIQIIVQMTGNPPDSIVEATECGAGPMRQASFPGGMVLNFQGGGLVGWTSTDPTIPVTGGIRAGDPAPDPSVIPWTSTTLGTEFTNGDVFGILTPDETSVQMMWAGVTCFFR